MLLFVRDQLSDRQLRLIAVAFCRRTLHLVADEGQKGPVEIAEQCADDIHPGRVALLGCGLVALLGCATADPSSANQGRVANGEGVEGR